MEASDTMLSGFFPASTNAVISSVQKTRSRSVPVPHPRATLMLHGH